MVRACKCTSTRSTDLTNGDFKTFSTLYQNALILLKFYPLFPFLEKHNHEEGVKRKRGPAKAVCPYNKASALQQMRDGVLGKVHDIEQMLKLGREIHSCPYYATRLAIPPAQVNQFIYCCISLLLFYCFTSLHLFRFLKAKLLAEFVFTPFIYSIFFMNVSIVGGVALSDGTS